MKDVDEFFEVDKDNNFVLKKNIKIDEDAKQKMLTTILEIQQDMATQYVENKFENSENIDKKID